MCAYGNVTSDTGMACSGDSGGPMVVRENERSELLFNSDYSNNCVQEYFDWCYKLWCATIHKWNLYHTLCTAVYACCLCTNQWWNYELDQRQHRWQDRNEEKQLRRYIDFLGGCQWWLIILYWLFWLDPLVMICKNIYLQEQSSQSWIITFWYNAIDCDAWKFIWQNGAVDEIIHLMYLVDIWCRIVDSEGYLWINIFPAHLSSQGQRRTSRWSPRRKWG